MEKRNRLVKLNLIFLLFVTLLFNNCYETEVMVDGVNVLETNEYLYVLNYKELKDTLNIEIKTELDSLNWEIQNIPDWLTFDDTCGTVYKDSLYSCKAMFSNTFDGKKSKKTKLLLAGENDFSLKITVKYRSKFLSTVYSFGDVFLILLWSFIILGWILSFFGWLKWNGRTFVLIVLSIFLAGVAYFIAFIPIEELSNIGVIQRWLAINWPMRIISALLLNFSLLLFFISKSESDYEYAKSGYTSVSGLSRDSYGNITGTYGYNIKERSEASADATAVTVSWFLLFLFCLIFILLAIFLKSWIIYLIIPTAIIVFLIVGLSKGVFS